jgi:hypothetical protein
MGEWKRTPLHSFPTRLRCYYHRDPQSRPVHWTSRPNFYPTPTPPYQIRGSRLCSEVSAADLSPVHFQCLLSRMASCYALIMRWLILSLLPNCLRSKTPFCLTLSQHLGALTSGWVVPLSAMELTPISPSSEVYGDGEF